MDLDRLKTIDLPGFLERHFGIEVASNGAARCPLHADENPSFSIFQKKDGTWGWKCHAGCGQGTILDLVMRANDIDLPTAAKKIAELEGITIDQLRCDIARVHVYTDEKGRELCQKVRLRRGGQKFTWRRRGPDNHWIYKGALDGIRKVPYRLDKILAEPTVIITEGEKDADTLAALGFPATSSPDGMSNWPDAITPFFAGKECAFVYDVGNEAQAWAWAAKLAPVAKSVSVMRIPDKDPKDDREFDITDLLEPIQGEEAKRDVIYKLMAVAKPVEPDEFPGLEPDPEPKSSTSATPAPMSLTLADVEPRAVPWLWPDFIPLGRATLVSGDPGCGKSWFCLDLASRLSRGLPWPDGTPGSGPARTYYMMVEDDLHDTVRPRISSLGGDPAMITCYNPEHPLHVDLASPEGLARLESEIVRLVDVRLVVVDPIIDFSGRANPNKAEDVRALLTPLIQLAAKHNFALVMIGHLNKAQALSAIYRAGGSTGGWLGKCRAAFMVFRDADDKPLRHVIPVKANLAHQDPAQLEFRITNGRLEIELSTEDVDVDDQLNPQRGPKPRERDDAQAWLRDIFVGRDEIPATEVEAAALRQGISESTLKRAKKQAGYRSVKHTESGGRTVWAWTKGATIP